ncbi:MAG: trypsin-like peptidase domain-containing protein [Ruminococcus sp.]|nr:trypsin-like peptidase domain-containing protein [Ruminococcus sp.]
MKVKKKLTSLILAGIMAVMSCGSLATSAEEEKKLPDPNGDGTLNISDSVLIMQYLCGAYAPTDIKELDVDRNGVVSYMDAKRIELYTARLESGLVEVPSYKDNTNMANTTRRYNIYDAKTGNYKSQYDLAPIPTVNKSRAVIGNDERVIDWTKSGVVKIMNSSNYIGSGFVVSDHVIATAAHCTKNYKISEILLFDNTGKVTLHATPVEYHIPQDYKKDFTYADEAYDYALITVKEDLSDYACFDLGVSLNSIKDNNAVVTVTGFPGEFNNHTKHMMYSGNGLISDINDSFIHYTADMTPGNSGGPVYITESIPGHRTYNTIVGINTANPDVENPKYNIGTRMTTDLINFYSVNNPNIKW